MSAVDGSLPQNGSVTCERVVARGREAKRETAYAEQDGEHRDARGSRQRRKFADKKLQSVNKPVPQTEFVEAGLVAKLAAEPLAP